jgi:CheY-specific phosphatase CheX
MKKKPLRIFSDSVIQYFTSFNIPIPKIKNTNKKDKFDLYELSCLIKFTGSRGGFCVVTSTREFLIQLINLILHQKNYDEETLEEALAEFSNIITGNAGRELHPDYDILPPINNIETIEDYLEDNKPISMFLVDYNSSKCKIFLGLE